MLNKVCTILDINKSEIMKNKLSLKADETFDTWIVKTVEWYLNKYGIAK